MGYDRDLNIALDILQEETLKFLSEWKGLGSKKAQQYQFKRTLYMSREIDFPAYYLILVTSNLRY
ncbi:MAG: hypothetical protein MUD14_18140 [Hydrococcus sp. Prado102]|jgi:hypothetical protein|nr:hypothetical protein [Hydrococcus sp. Prado102]